MSSCSFWPPVMRCERRCGGRTGKPMCWRCCARAGRRRRRAWPSSPPTSRQTRAGARRSTGCDYVLHVASPLSTSVPKDENEMIVPARDGTLRVLRAARDAGVRRVVITSSIGAIGYGHPPREKPFDETEWTNLARQRCAAVHQVQDAGRAGGLGFHRARGRRARIVGDQPRRRFSARCWGRISPARSRSSNRCWTAPCRRCRGSISASSTCAMSPICICGR